MGLAGGEESKVGELITLEIISFTILYSIFMYADDMNGKLRIVYPHDDTKGQQPRTTAKRQLFLTEPLSTMDRPNHTEAALCWASAI